MTDPFDLQRFVDAQQRGGVYDRARREIQEGHKQTHWMRFVFPQLVGLGRSEMAQRYAISGLEEAQAYLAHPVLGPRLRESTEALTGLPTADAIEVFGAVDAQKLHSSMTLFARAAPHEEALTTVLDRFFGGKADSSTTSRL